MLWGPEMLIFGRLLLALSSSLTSLRWIESSTAAQMKVASALKGTYCSRSFGGIDSLEADVALSCGVWCPAK